MEQLVGTIHSIKYTNDKNGYTVCDLKAGKKLITLVGYMPMLVPGESMVALGEWITHNEYGRQFNVKSCERKAPSALDEMEKYLGSGFIKGLGPATARRIVETFTEETFDIMRSEPMRLSEIRGITAEKALAYGQAFLEYDAMRGTIMLMQRYGIPASYTHKVWKKFGQASEEEIQRNPYRLSEADIGLGFQFCDRIALGLGIDPCSIFRLKSALHYLLALSVQNGHSYYPLDKLLEESQQLTHAAQGLIQNALDQMLLEESVFIDKKYPDRIYTDLLFEAESYCAARLVQMNAEPDDCPDCDVERWLSDFESKNNILLDGFQKDAARCALKSGICVITGGPGTGKTTIIKALIHVFAQMDKSVFLCAPTGRASKRVSETSGCEAKTIHRLLEVGYAIDKEERPYFSRNEDNPLEAEVIIVDETSMIDIVIMSALLRAIPEGCRLVLVGDVDQLPSVGPGKVLGDIIGSKLFPVVKLERIFRQSEESMIILNAHKINQGIQPLINGEESDFYFIQRMDAREAVKAVVELCAAKIPERFGFDPMREIQVLTPMRKGETGVYSLNQKLQERLNPFSAEKPEKVSGNTIWRLGDRVMQIRNDYTRPWTQANSSGGWLDGQGVYNGDTGVILDIDSKAQILTIRFDDLRTCEYAFDSLDDLEHAYAVTVHKSQGSEFPAVIIPLFAVPSALVCRNLIYTAVTRAKKLVIFVGNPFILEQMVENINEKERFSGLKERFHGFATR